MNKPVYYQSDSGERGHGYWGTGAAAKPLHFLFLLSWFGPSSPTRF